MVDSSWFNEDPSTVKQDRSKYRAALVEAKEAFNAILDMYDASDWCIEAKAMKAIKAIDSILN